MSNTHDIIDGEATDVATGQSVTAAVASENTALATAGNPYLAMAERAMELNRMDQLDRLLDLQMRWDAEQQRKAYVAAMAAFKAEPIRITKSRAVGYTTKEGDFVGYKHAQLADVVDGVVAHMGKHGLSHRWDVTQEEGKVEVTCIVTHRDGHSESVTMSAAPDNSGKKNAIQQVASTVTYLQRYTLMSACGVAAADMDDDGRAGGAPEPEANITPEQAKILGDLIEVVIRRKAAFMEWVGSQIGYKIEDIALLPASKYQAVHDELGRIQARRAAQAEKEAGNAT